MRANRLFQVFFFSIFFAIRLCAVDVGSAAALETGIIDANAGTETEINFLNDIPYTQIFRPLNSTSSFTPTSETYTIDGKGFSLTTGGDFRGFFARGGGGGGRVTIQNLTFSGARAKGGDNVTRGGGGAGLGGALFVHTGANITIRDVIFTGCSAEGGSSSGATIGGGGGGGGLLGIGGPASVAVPDFGGGGGGAFFGDGGSSSLRAGGGGGGAGTDGMAAPTADDGGDGGDDFSLVTGGGAGGVGVPPSLDGGDGGPGGGGGGGAWDLPGVTGGDGGAGGFGGAGGGSSLAGVAGTGDFASGGGGGGAGFTLGISGTAGGDGGFGGGGGAGGGGIGFGSLSAGGDGGDGGFGAGGGGGGAMGDGTPGTGGTGGFGGGAGATGGAVGGLGGGGGAMGGAIFVQDGGSLTVEGGISFSGSSITAGTGNISGSTFGTDIFLMSGGEIEFDITTDSSIPTAIESDMLAAGSPGGGIVKKGSARLTLTGANTYTGTTEVTEGTLILNGSMITPVTVTGGTFGGDGTIIAADLDNESGTVAPGSSFGTINVGGDYTQLASATFLTEVDAIGNVDLLAVTGSAMLDGTLTVSAIGSNFIEGSTYTILTAVGGRTGMFATENIPLTTHGTPLFSVSYFSNSVVLTVLDNTLFETDCDYQGNEKKVVDYFLSLLPIDPNSEIAFVVEVLGLLDCEDQKKALDQLHPAQFGALEWINLTNSGELASIFASQSQAVLCSPCSKRPIKLWFEPFGSWIHQSRLTELIGFRTSSAGFTAGFDRCFTNFLIGFGAGYSHTNLRWDRQQGVGDIQSLNVGLYGNYNYSVMILDFSVLGGANLYDLIRKIDFSAPDPGAIVKFNAKSNHYGLNFTTHIGINFDWNEKRLPLRTFANVDYIYLYQNRFREHGASSLDLDVRTKVSNMLRTELGFEFTTTFEAEGICWAPYLSASWISKIPLSNGNYRSNFAPITSTFVVDTTSKAIQQIAPSLGVRVTSEWGFSLMLEGRAELSGLLKNYFANMRIAHRF